MGICVCQSNLSQPWDFSWKPSQERIRYAKVEMRFRKIRNNKTIRIVVTSRFNKTRLKFMKCKNVREIFSYPIIESWRKKSPREWFYAFKNFVKNCEVNFWKPNHLIRCGASHRLWFLWFMTSSADGRGVKKVSHQELLSDANWPCDVQIRIWLKLNQYSRFQNKSRRNRAGSFFISYRITRHSVSVSTHKRRETNQRAEDSFMKLVQPKWRHS